MYSCSPLFSVQVIFQACCYFSMCESPKALLCKYSFTLLLNSSKLFAFIASFGKDFPRLLLPPACLISKLRSTSLLSPSLCGNRPKTSIRLAAFLQPCLLCCALVEQSVLDTSAGFQWNWTDVFWFALLFWVQPSTDVLMEAATLAQYLFQSSTFHVQNKTGTVSPRV